jgi:hypothetical protein
MKVINKIFLIFPINQIPSKKKKTKTIIEGEILTSNSSLLGFDIVLIL